MKPTKRPAGSQGRLPARVRWAYALPSFVIAFVGIPVYVLLPRFYTDVVGVPMATVGAIMLGARLFDAVTDPAVGVLSDRLRTRWGRRRPFIAVAAVPLAVSIYFLLTPPPQGAALWLAGWLVLMFASFTALVVPYESLAPELSHDYHERTALIGLRDGTLVAGTVVAAAAPFLLGRLFALPEGEVGERAELAWMGRIYAPLVIVLSAICVYFVRERTTTRAPARRLRLAAVRHNRAFTILLGGYTLATTGFSLSAGLLLYYVRYVLGAEDAELFLIVYLAAGVIALPLWVASAKRWGKRKSWMAGMALYAAGGTAILFLGAGQTTLFSVLCAVCGSTFGATVAVPASMLADTIDHDELETGEHREGLYLGIWSIARKGAAAIGVGVALPILDVVGYEPDVDQTPATKFAMTLLYAGVPVLCNLVAIALARRYPIDARRQAEIRALIEQRGS
jgi:glycoside/pentoside/hexuronide:cation symporter, GPH family